MEKNKEWLHYVEDRLLQLKTLKDKYDLSSKAKEWKEKANMKEVDTPTDENDFRTQVSGTVKRQKDSELSASLPEYQFIAEDDDGSANKRIVKQSWLYHWLVSNTDKIIGKIVSSATTYGTWIMYEWIKHTQRKVNMPYMKKHIFWPDTLEHKVETINKSEIYCEKIPFANFFINGTDIDEATEAVVVSYKDKDAYMADRKDNPMYKNISKLSETSKVYTLADADGEDIGSWADGENIITEIKYYNVWRDEFKIIANGIEIHSSYIPYAHKKLPFAIFFDNLGEDRFWGIGEFELLESDELAKNEYRSLTVKAVKASIGFILMDEGSDLEIEDMKYWVREVYKTDDVDSFQHFAPNIPIQAISELEQKVDNDIMAKSWVDFKSLQLWPQESATKTASKWSSGRKRINKNIRDNAFDFYRRLGELRMSNIQQLHTMKERRIPIKGWSIDNKWNFKKDDANDYGSAIIGADFIKWEFRVIPIVETMLGNSNERKKEELGRFAERFGNVMDEEGKPVIKGEQLVALWCEVHNFDYEKLTEKWIASKSTKSIVDGVFNKAWQEGWAPSPQGWGWKDAEFYNKMYAKDQVKPISGQAKIPLNIEE